MEQIQRSQLKNEFLKQSFIEKNLSAFDILKLLHQNGVEARFIGNIVRHFLIHTFHPHLLVDQNESEYDLCVKASPQQIKNIIIKNQWPLFCENLHYGTFNLKYKNYYYDLTSLRQDSSYTGRHCRTVFIDSFEMDSQRRDFTCNAISVDQYGEFHDDHNGIEDILNKKINFIGNPRRRIEEDSLRLWRYIRFCSELGIVPEESIMECATGNIKVLQKLSFKRIAHEIAKIINNKNNIFYYLNLINNYKLAEKHLGYINVNFNEFSPSEISNYFPKACPENLNYLRDQLSKNNLKNFHSS